MSLQDLYDLGCPELEPGEFYRIDWDGHAGWTLEVRVGRRHRGSRCVRADYIYEQRRVWNDEAQTDWHYEDNTPTEAIVLAAKRIETARKTRTEHRDWNQQMSELRGDHR